MSETKKDLVLDVRNLTVHYVLEEECVEAVNDVSIQLEKGKILGLVGETGAGKTSVCLSILNLIPNPPGVIKGGEIYVNGKDILNADIKTLKEIRGKEVSMIFQDPMSSLNPVFTVGAQIAVTVMPGNALKKCWSWWEFPRDVPTSIPISSPVA